MELRHIRYFIRVAELLHFTHAAESLHVSQPTLSTHIQQLEEEIGCPLFDRGRNLRLTEAGQLLLVRARESYRQLQLAKEEIGELRSLVRGTLTFGATYIFIPKIVPKLLAAYAAAYPEVQVSMHVGNSQQIAQEVLTRTIDVGLTCMLHDSKMEYEELFCDEVVLVVSRHHALADRTEIGLQELGDYPLLLPSIGFSTRRCIEQRLMEENISLKVLLEINDFPALLTMVKNEDVATVGCRGAVADDPGVHVVSLSGATSPITLSKGLLRSKDAPLSAAARAFVELTKSQFAPPCSGLMAVDSPEIPPIS